MNFLKLANWLFQRGNNIIIYAAKNTRLLREVEEAGIPFRVIKRHRKYFDGINAIRVAKKLKKDNTDILFIADNRDTEIAAVIKTYLNRSIKIVYQQQMLVGVSKKDKVHTWRYSNLDAWIAPLHILENEVKMKTYFDPAKIHIIPLCVDTEKFQSEKYEKTEARKKLNLPTEKIIIGIIGRITRNKGQLLVVNALKLLIEKKYQLDLLILGEPTIGETESHDYLKLIKNEIKDNGLEENVHIRPFTKDIRLFYDSIDIFVLGSTGETFGMVTVEAMLAGLPIVATNSGGTPEILDYGKYGFLYEPNNEKQLADKISLILNNVESSKKLAESAKERAVNYYSHDYECKEIENLFNSL